MPGHGYAHKTNSILAPFFRSHEPQFGHGHLFGFSSRKIEYGDLGQELVSSAMDPMKVLGMGRLCFQFFAQLQNVVIGCREAGDHQAHRMAYLPAHVLHFASGRGSGSESNAGTAATLHDPCDLGYLHPGGDSRQAYSPHRGSLADCWKWRIEAD